MWFRPQIIAALRNIYVYHDFTYLLLVLLDPMNWIEDPYVAPVRSSAVVENEKHSASSKSSGGTVVINHCLGSGNHDTQDRDSWNLKPRGHCHDLGGHTRDRDIPHTQTSLPMESLLPVLEVWNIKIHTRIWIALIWGCSRLLDEVS